MTVNEAADRHGGRASQDAQKIEEARDMEHVLVVQVAAERFRAT
jgi:hypothetical protein